MSRRALQRLVRLSPDVARLAWQALPDRARGILSPFIHPIAVGARAGTLRLSVERSANDARFDLVLGSGAELAPTSRRMLESGGLRVFELGRRSPAELMRSERVLDAVVVVPASDDRLRREVTKVGWRVTATAVDLEQCFPEVTIVIPTHAARELCQSCLHGIQRGTGWPRYQVVVVDDASRDGTREMLAGEASRDPRISVVRLDTQHGFARACNAGIERAKGEYVVLLNDDTVVGPGWLSRLVAHLEADANLGLVCPVTNQVANEARIDVTYDSYDGMSELSVQRAFDHAGERRMSQAAALFCAALRRDVLASVGGLDERYEIGMFEDDDLSLTLAARGLCLAIADDAFVHHVGQATLGRLDDDAYLAIWAKNKQRFETKWGRTWRPPER